VIRPGKQFIRVMELLGAHRISAIVSAVVCAAELGVDDPAAIELLLVQNAQNASTTVVAMDIETLPDVAKISAPRPRLDGYAIADLKENAA
jgi:hypothetical protein